MEEIKTQLPENAFRELKEGEEYEPLMSPSDAAVVDGGLQNA